MENPIVENTRTKVRVSSTILTEALILASSAGMLGQSIKENTLWNSRKKSQSVLTREKWVGGMGIKHREQFVKGEYDDQIRDSMRPRLWLCAMGK
jgi:hypothetical protein